MAPALASTTPPVTAPPPVVIHLVSSAPAGWQVYTVRRGDTLSAIAARLGTTSAVIAAQNQLPNGGRLIRVGDVLVVPGSGMARPTPVTATSPQAASSPSASSSVAQAKPAAWTSTAYTVRRGDTVDGISRRAGVSQVSVIKANGLVAPYRIQVGQVLQVPAAPGAPVATTASNSFAGRTYPQSTLDAAAAARKALKTAPVPSRQEMRAIIERTALKHGVDPKLALAVGYQESGWDHRQVSVANAIGAMQVIPSSGKWAASLVGRPLDLLQAEDNATAGVVILRALTRSCSSLDEAIAGYYQGLTSVRSTGMYPDTAVYVANIKALMTRM